MFKRGKPLFSAKFLVLPGAIGMLLYFQNCAPPREFNAMSAEFSSLTSQDMKHEDPHLPTEEKVRLETTYEPLLVDRRYLHDLFVDVFGPSAKTLTVGPTLFSDAVEMGSICSIYEDYKVRNAKGAIVQNNAIDTCGQGSARYQQVQLVPKPTVKRQALINRFCSDLLGTDATFNFILKKISPSEAVPVPNRDNLLKLFHLFYRVHPEPHQGLVDSLNLMFSSSRADNTTKVEWKAAILAVCTSSQWQVL